MGKHVRDIVGKKFGRLTVLRRSALPGRIRWLCACECGKEVDVFSFNLVRGNTVSCGCARIRHGLTNSRVHGIWRSMLQRCENPNNDAFHNYGERGIVVCKRWHEFDAFFADMDHPPDETATLERVNNNGPYQKSNCIWASRKVQLNNRRGNHVISAFGRQQSIALWAQEFGINENTLRNRLIRAKMDPETALSAPMYAQQRGAI